MSYTTAYMTYWLIIDVTEITAKSGVIRKSQTSQGRLAWKIVVMISMQKRYLTNLCYFIIIYYSDNVTKHSTVKICQFINTFSSKSPYASIN